MTHNARFGVDYRADSARFMAVDRAAPTVSAHLSTTALSEESAMPDTGFIPVAGDESSLAHNMGVNSQEINALAPRSRLPWLRAARALEAAAQRRRIERRAGA